MRTFIPSDPAGHPCTPNAFTTFTGLREMGYECIFFQKIRRTDREQPQQIGTHRQWHRNNQTKTARLRDSLHSHKLPQ